VGEGTRYQKLRSGEFWRNHRIVDYPSSAIQGLKRPRSIRQAHIPADQFEREATWCIKVISHQRSDARQKRRVYDMLAYIPASRNISLDDPAALKMRDNLWSPSAIS
jgi:hypothetical protein